MATYDEVYDEIINTLMGRPEGTEVQPDEHQNFALALLDYIRSVELMGSSVFQGPAYVSTVPLEPENSNLAYTSFAPSNQTTYWVHFIGQDGQAVHVTMDEGHVGIVILYWNKEYWSAQVIAVPIAAVDVVNNLNTDDAFKALSAAMGKLLNEKKLEAEDYESEVEEMPSNYYTKDEVRALVNAHNVNQEKELRRFEQVIRQEINSYRPIVINGDVVNAPDEEDITTDENHLLKLKNRSGLNGMGYVIVRQDETFKNQVDVSQAGAIGTIYEIRYDFDLGGTTVTLPADCVLNFTGGKLTNGTLVMNNTSLMGQVDLEVNTSGSCADSIGYQSWFGGIDYWHTFINNVTGVQVYEYKQGTYTPTVMINKMVTDKCVTIHGNGAILKFTYTTHNQKCMQFSPATAYSDDDLLTANVSKGVTEIPVSTISKFAIGDTVVVRDLTMSSFNYDRDYQQGEFAKVRQIDSANSKVILDHGLYGSYLHYSTSKNKIAKVGTIAVNIDNLTLNLTNPASVLQNYVYGLHISNADGFVLSNVRCDDFTHCIALRYCQNGLVENCTSISNAIIYTSNDNYGLSIINCQDVVVSGGTYAAGNHGIAMGGNYGDVMLAIVNRNITVENTTSYCTKDTTGGSSIDTHSNADGITIRNNRCRGIDFSGRNFLIEGNYVTEKGIQAGHMNSFNNKILNNTLLNGDIRVVCTEASTYTRSLENWVPDTGLEVLEIAGNSMLSAGDAQGNLHARIVMTPGNYPNVANVRYNVHDNYLNNTVVVLNTGYASNDATSLSYGAIDFCNNRMEYTSTATIGGTNYIYGKRVSVRNNEFTGLKKSINLLGKDLFISGNTIRAMLVVNVAFYLNADTSGLVVDNLVVKNNYADDSVRYLCSIANNKRVNRLVVDGNIFDWNSNTVGYIAYNNYTGDTPGDVIVINNMVKKATYCTKVNAVGTLIYKNNINTTTGALDVPSGNSSYPPAHVYALDGMSGTTTTRTGLSLASDNAGLQYYDTTLKKYVLWNGTAWTNLDGTSL